MSPRERTPEEREAARLERARRRAEREGRPFRPEEHALPPTPPPWVERTTAPADPPPEEPPPAPLDPPPAAEPPRAGDGGAHDPAPPPADDPQATQQWDVTVDWQDEPPAAAPPRRRRTPLAADLAAGPAAPTADRGGAAVPPADVDPPPADGGLAPGADPRQPAADPAEIAAPSADDAADGAAVDPDATRVHAPAADPAPTGDLPVADEVPLGTRRVTGGRGRRPGARGGAAREDRRRPRARMRRPGELGPPRRRTSRGGRIAAVAVVLLAVALGWFVLSLFQPFHGGAGGGRVQVTIPDGADAGEIGALLAERGVVDSGFFFNLRATLAGDRGKLRSGRHVLRQGMSYAAALDALTAAPAVRAPPTVTVMIPEGRSRREAAALVRRAGLRGDYVRATRRARGFDPRRYGAPRGATLEGFLFPATYELPRGARVQRLVAEQLRAFERNFRSVDLSRARRANLTAYDVLIIASMIEREVTLPRERPLVAAVIYNRLREGIPLGIDATLRYEQNDWVNPLRQSVLDADTPFNTRIRPGLPPGPIGSPGLASIRAAARPARVDYTYYVVDPCSRGAHAFATTYDEHLANVARYDRAREAADGDGLRC